MDSNQKMAAYFDTLAPAWGNTPAEYDMREALTEMMRLPPNGVIADIGCGKGVMFEHLLKTNPAQLIAVDISGEMLRLAQTLFDDARIVYRNEDFLYASLPPLDAAVIFNAYPHFLDRGALAEKLAQSVRQGGAVIIAHSRSRARINGTHNGERVSALSVPLESAEGEAAKFLPYFTPEMLVDNDEMYFVKLIRN